MLIGARIVSVPTSNQKLASKLIARENVLEIRTEKERRG